MLSPKILLTFIIFPCSCKDTLIKLLLNTPEYDPSSSQTNLKHCPQSKICLKTTLSLSLNSTNLGFGYIAERTHTRWGRFRPYVIFGAPVLSITMVLAFVNPFNGSGAKIAWAGITYVLLCFAYTVANMSYGSLAGVITTDSDERVTLNWVRSQGSTIAQLILQTATPVLLVFFVATEAAKEKGFDSLWSFSG